MKTWSLFLIVGLVFFVLAMGSVVQEEKSVPIMIILWGCSFAMVAAGILLKVQENSKTGE